MLKFYTEEEMYQKEALFALVCIGGMAEGFNYAQAKKLMKFWADKRRDCAYHGGFVDEDAKPQ